jgi:hypothetical protein
MALAGKRIWYHPAWFAKHIPNPDIEGATTRAQIRRKRTRRRWPLGSAGITPAALLPCRCPNVQSGDSRSLAAKDEVIVVYRRRRLIVTNNRHPAGVPGRPISHASAEAGHAPKPPGITAAARRAVDTKPL